MRIGVLEWASCTGPEDPNLLDDSIRREGWAMCRSALLSLASAGHQAVAVIEQEYANELQLAKLPRDALELVVPLESRGKRAWQEVYPSCEFTLVIAPEMDNILKNTLKWCSKRGIRTCNADEEFLSNASDKLATATCLRRENVPHPPTRSLARAEPSWIRATNEALADDTGREAIWVMKPRAGVGCENIVRMTAGKIQKHRKRNGRHFDSKDWIVQPWLPGQSFSRAAIFDDNGQPHWLPVTSQHLSVTDSVHYCGGAVEPEQAVQMVRLDDVLTRAGLALGAGRRGWIGFDFLYDPGSASAPVTVIEVNPRLTTSFVGLCAAGAPGLAALIVSACQNKPIEMPTLWQSVRFDTAGNINGSS